jgi:hypothetical protein
MFSSDKWFGASADFYPETIDQSLRFDGSSSYLTKTPSSDGNRRKWTFSAWIKFAQTDDLPSIFGKTRTGNNREGFAIGSSQKLQYQLRVGSTTKALVESEMVLRDSTNWYHIMMIWDSDNATASNRVIFYVNGQNAGLEISTTPVQYTDSYINSTNQNYIGWTTGGSNYLHGYMAEVNFVDGQALTPSSFGETKNGVWIPKSVSGLTYGTNGFRLTFADSSSLGDDTSGNTNNYSTNGLASTDVVLDSPTNNFPTLNSIGNDSGVTFSEGNLKASVGSGDTKRCEGTFAVSSGKWYFEVNMLSFSGSSTAMIGLKDLSVSGHENDNFTNSSVYAYYSNTGNKYNSGNLGSYGATYTTGDIIGIALDLDAGTLTFYKNGSSQGTAFSSLSGEYTIHLGTGLNAWVGVVNFGQDGTFAGNETAQGNTDGNGIGDFYYSPPSGYLALCSSNLPDSTISPNQDTQADDHFDTIIYDGSASNQTITTNFQADFLWFKERTTNGIQHQLFDSSRVHSSSSAKFGRKIETTSADAEADSTAIVSQSTNDITLLGGVSTTNDAFSRTYVMWHWKANGGTLTTNDASATGVGTIDSQYQANTTAGFSIVTYTGTGSAGTIAHGLGVKPSHIAVKARSHGGTAFQNYHGTEGATKYVSWYSSQTSSASSDRWNNTEPTSTVFSVGTHVGVNNSSSYTYVAYVFAEIEGYSKIGTYTGNGSTDGTFIYTGFRPAWVMSKGTTTTSNWYMNDTARSPYNPTNTPAGNLYADLNNAESGNGIDILSNGYKIRHGGDSNASSVVYIYMAFAEQPFKFSNAR